MLEKKRADPLAHQMGKKMAHQREIQLVGRKDSRWVDWKEMSLELS